MAMTKEAVRTADAPMDGAGGEIVDAARLAQRLGRYQLVVPLAQGGMGVVFAARLLGDHGVERLVAIKTLRPITSASDRSALLREARLTARLHHRNVVATLDLGEVDAVPYVVMELVDGVALSRLLSAVGPEGLDPGLAAWIVMQAAFGLHAAHELTDAEGRPLRLVHRDVSPQNILVSMQGEVKIADFGIAKFAGREESTATGMIKGKFGYMSPEQASDGELDRRSDVFALGIVLWEALTGRRLFQSDTPARTIMRVLEQPARPPNELRTAVGAELSAIALRCVAKSPDERYPTALAVAEALRVALRAAPSPVDETDVAAVAHRLFGEERARFMRRVQESASEDGTTRTFVSAGEASGLAALSVSSEVRRASPRSHRRRLVVAVALVFGAAGLVTWRVGALRDRSVTKPEVTTSPPSSPTASTSTSAAASGVVPSPLPPASVSVAAELSTPRVPSPAASAPRAPAYKPQHRRIEPARPSSSAHSAARPSATPAPPLSSASGVPFERL